MTHTITIHLSDPLYKRLQRTGELSHQPIETVVEQSLSHSLPALLDDIPAEYQADIYPLVQMGNAELQAEVKTLFPTKKWGKYETLLEKQKGNPLSALEKAQLDSLRREANVLMFRKGYAAVLLKRRGYRVPTLNELPTAS